MKATRHPLRVIVLFVFLLFFAIWLWNQRVALTQGLGGSSPQAEMQLALKSPVDFVKSHVTGGVGVALMTDNVTGLPVVSSVIIGSPAEKAGLRRDDIITKVGGKATAGHMLAQMVDAIRGFAGSMVTIEVKRRENDSAEVKTLSLVIHRSSWNALGVPNAVSTPLPVPATNTGTPPFMVPNTTN